VGHDDGAARRWGPCSLASDRLCLTPNSKFPTPKKSLPAFELGVGIRASTKHTRARWELIRLLPTKVNDERLREVARTNADRTCADANPSQRVSPDVAAHIAGCEAAAIRSTLERHLPGERRCPGKAADRTGPIAIGALPRPIDAISELHDNRGDCLRRKVGRFDRAHPVSREIDDVDGRSRWRGRGPGRGRIAAASAAEG